jgi:AdoMet-dependent rRNA methyltransferase SPB1
VAEEVEPAEEDLLPKSKKQRAKLLKKREQEEKKEQKEGAKGIVFVKADPELDEEDYDDDRIKGMLMTDPKTMSLATQLVADRRRNREEMVDKSFNRYAFGDNKFLPAWFREDEAHHNKPQEPLSKDAAALIKERMRKLQAQPGKKVLEAKGRNKMRAIKRLEALKRKATVIADSEEIGGRQKSEQIEKMMRAAKKPTRKEKKVVVAKGKLKGVKGRPKGVKGHYKMVDGRAKKDARAKSRVQKHAKNGRRRK